MRKRRGHEELEPERSGKRQLARLDTATRAGVLEELQRAGGNRAVQEVVAGAKLQRDVAAPTRPSTAPKGRMLASTWALSLNGTVVGPVRSVEGCSIRSEVISQRTEGGDVRKHPGQPHYDPCVLEVGLGVGKGLFDWIGGVFDRKGVRKELILHQLDQAGHEQAQLVLQEALLTGFELPQLGAADTGPAWLKLTVAADRVQRANGSGANIGTKSSDPLDPSTVRFQVSGIGQVAELTSLASWAFTQATKREDPSWGLEPAGAKLGNVVVTLAEGAKGGGAGIAGFDAWVEDFLVSGNSGKEHERTASLTVSSAGGRKLELSFTGVGIFSADQLARSGGGGRRYGLYVEGAKLRVS